MNIVDAIQDERLFRPFLGDLSSWRAWRVALRAVYGLPITSATGKDLFRQFAQRDADQLPKEGFDTALLLTGRRSGKSRIAAVCGAFEAVLSGRESRLAKGEQGLVAVVSPTTKQSTIVKNYLRSVFETPVLAKEVVNEQRDGFELRNGVRIQILAGDFRTVRGFTLLAAVVDEICFMGVDGDQIGGRVLNDSSLINALRPSLATTKGRLIAISSPYAKRGWAYERYQNALAMTKPARSSSTLRLAR